MSLYDFLKFLHVTLVILWIGSAIVQMPMALRVRSKDLARKHHHSETAAFLGQRWFPPLAGLTGLTGIALWIDGPYDFGVLWINLALAGWLVSSIVGGVFFGRAVPQMEQAYGAGDEAAGDALLGRILAVARFDMVLTLLIVFDMVVKPG